MIPIEEKLREIVEKALASLEIKDALVNLEHPTELSHGDYSTNVALALAKKTGQKPSELADKIVEVLKADLPEEVSSIEIAGPGFINFFLSKEFYSDTLKYIIEKKEEWGKSDKYKGKKVMVEYTDPNPFKAFHIGHLMSNTIGESISRLIEFSGAEVYRATYQGDVGPHVAKAIWGLKQGEGDVQSAEGLGKAYSAGASAYEDNQEEIDNLNKKLYEKSDEELNQLYEKGREASLKHFEEIYNKLGSNFDSYFFESETWKKGTELVKKHTGSVFEKSEGAVVFHAEEYDKKLHTRVFVNSKGLPTYEAKELGLPYIKYEKYPFDVSITITAEEQKVYFQVVAKALEQFDKEMAGKLKHISHGFMKLPTGKMSSRTGDVVTGESLLNDVEEKVLELMKDRDIEDKKEIARVVAVSAIKYSILRQNAGKDIIYDLEKSLSFEGDSGPYLQYAHTRAQAVLEKAQAHDNVKENKNDTSALEKLLYRFPEVVAHAKDEFEPHHVTTYLTELAGAFNSFYATEKIIDGENEEYSLALTKAFKITMKNGLYLLGIKVPAKM